MVMINFYYNGQPYTSILCEQNSKIPKPPRLFANNSLLVSYFRYIFAVFKQCIQVRFYCFSINNQRIP